jgi:anti-sigma B factor antagonist
MSDAPSPVAVINHGPIRVVEFVQSKILDEANIADIGTRVGDVIDAEPRPRLLLDFRNVDHLSSAALGMLINANNRVREKNGELRLCDIKRQILEVFTITKLDKLFRIYPNRQAALDSFGVQKTDI